jgi:hypothetical protein
LFITAAGIPEFPLRNSWNSGIPGIPWNSSNCDADHKILIITSDIQDITPHFHD